MEMLPECLIHKILSHLKIYEAAKLSLVSKTWLQAWFTHPNLEFTIEYGKGNNNNNNNRKIVDQIMERYRDRKIHIEKFQLSISVSSYHHLLAFPHMDEWLTIALQSGVKNLVFDVSGPSYPFPIFTFLAANSLTELVLSGCNLSLSTTQVVTCHSLRNLSLSHVPLDDNLLQTLINCCPFIVDLIIDCCPLLTKIELRNQLQNINSVSIYSCGNQSVKIQAPTLQHLSYFGCFWEGSPILDIFVECQNLKSLKLSDTSISEGVFQHLISTSQFLESLILYDLSTNLERNKICGIQSLKLLAILNCKGLWEIDAPNLVSLEYEGDQIPELKIAKESVQLNYSRICLYPLKIFNDAWFSELRKLLSNSTSWFRVSLYFEECIEINTNDLELHHTAAATPEVDILTVDIESSGKYPMLVDALLWSCHPRRLHLYSTIEMIICFMDRLTCMKKNSTYHGSKTWHSQLKEAKAYKFDNMELKSGDLAMRTLTEMETVCFQLDW